MRRHDLAYVLPNANFRFQCGASNVALATQVSSWIGKGRPLVVARQTGQEHELLLGLTLPTSEGRQRIGCLVHRRDVSRISGPLALTACIHRLPPHIAPHLSALASRLADEDVEIGTYGSLAWEVLSQESYRHAASDVDVICDVATLAQAERALQALSEAAALIPCGLDGEIRFPNGAAVAWKELAAAWNKDNSQVLIKGLQDVALLPLASILAQFNEVPAHA